MSEMLRALQRASEMMARRHDEDPVAQEVLAELAKAAEYQIEELHQELQDTRLMNSNFADSIASLQYQLAAAKQRIADLEKPGDLREFLTEIRRELRRAA